MQLFSETNQQNRTKTLYTSDTCNQRQNKCFTDISPLQVSFQFTILILILILTVATIILNIVIIITTITVLVL